MYVQRGLVCDSVRFHFGAFGWCRVELVVGKEG